MAEKKHEWKIVGRSNHKPSIDDMAKRYRSNGYKTRIVKSKTSSDWNLEVIKKQEINEMTLEYVRGTFADTKAEANKIAANLRKMGYKTKVSRTNTSMKSAFKWTVWRTKGKQ